MKRAAILAMLVAQLDAAYLVSRPFRTRWKARRLERQRTTRHGRARVAVGHLRDSFLDTLSKSVCACHTVTQTYWDTPYEAVMQPTSNRDKFTMKGIIVESAPPGDTKISTAQGDFTIPATLAIGDPPPLVLDNRASIQAIPPSRFITFDADVEDYPSLVETRDGTLWVAYQSFIKRRRPNQSHAPRQRNLAATRNHL